MGETAKLSPEACRAGRAILRWSVARLSEQSGVRPNTIAKVENGGPVKDSVHRQVIAAFEKAGVEILNGDGTGARLVRRN
jgi:transcriptional regulator with XRE-family HTH domain